MSLDEKILDLTAQIVQSHISRNPISPDELPNFIRSVRKGLADTGAGGGDSEPEQPQQKPAVPINKSIKPNFLICLEDGSERKMLKRYLKTKYDMTPDQYRKKWGLPPDYPMTAPNYSKQRSSLAKSTGLGQVNEKS